MTTAEYRAALAALGLTQAGGARFLGVDERTSRKWATGERNIPEPVSRFLRFLIAAKIKPSRVTLLIELDI